MAKRGRKHTVPTAAELMRGGRGDRRRQQLITIYVPLQISVGMARAKALASEINGYSFEETLVAVLRHGLDLEPIVKA